MSGAAKRTRTSTPVKGLAPQASASTNSAMAADALREQSARQARRLTNSPYNDKAVDNGENDWDWLGTHVISSMDLIGGTTP
jgi:hypothetical protein